VAGLALIAGITVASAQNAEPGGEAGGGTNQQMKTTPGGGAGRAGHEASSPRGAGEHNGSMRREGGPRQGAGAAPEGGASGGAPASPKERAAHPANRAGEPASGTKQRHERNAGSAEPQRRPQNAGQGERPGGRAEGHNARGGAGRHVNITTKDRTTIRQTIIGRHVAPARDVHFGINVGVRVPRTLVLHRLPPRIVEIVPDYEGYEFFVLPDRRIVIVDPATYEIVAVITS
jgi:hypothetical protein